MVEIRETALFTRWMERLDFEAQARILNRIERLRKGNPGDVRSVGEGVSELRIHSGPGYRVYYVQRRRGLIVLLVGGDKSSQRRDIRRALAIAREPEEN